MIMHTGPEKDATPQMAEPTLAEIIKRLWRARYALLICLIVSWGVAGAWLWLSPRHYQAEMLVSPPGKSINTGLTRLLGLNDLPALNSIITESITNADADFARFLNILRGPAVAGKLGQDKGVRAQMAQGSWRVKQEDLATPAGLSAYLKDRVHISRVGATRMRRITYAHPDPAFSRTLLQMLHNLADERLRTQQARRTAARIAYLARALENVANPEHRKALTALLMEQEQARMMANMEAAFAAQIVEPPAVSPRPVWPRPYLTLLVAALIAVLLGYVIYYLRRPGPP